MNLRQPDSNVYYLPLPDAAATTDLDLADAQPRLGRRLRHAWWRLRVAFAEIRAILRPCRRLPLGEYASLFDDEAPRPWARRRGPARVIDLASARLRLRPADAR